MQKTGAEKRKPARETRGEEISWHQLTQLGQESVTGRKITRDRTPAQEKPSTGCVLNRTDIEK
jgi:hypothetical protein